PQLPGLGATSAIGQAGDCPAGARSVTYEVAAFQQLIPVNGWGDHIADGLVYALRNDDARIGKQQMADNPNLTQPLVIRANVGDCVTVKLRNDIEGRRVGMRVDGLVQHDPKTSDGAAVGNNPDSSVAAGQEIAYTWYADREGEAPIVDAANLDTAAADHSSVQRGLYGALVVHPKDSKWTNPRTGEDLLSDGRAVETQLFADIEVPGSGNDYRSFAMVMLDENEDVKDRDGNIPTFPTTGLQDSTFGINYRSEPLRNRLRAIMEHRGEDGVQDTPGGSSDGQEITLPNGRVIKPTDHFCDGWDERQQKVVEDPGAKCMSEESHLQSWVFGDEGTLTRATEDGLVVDTDNLIPKAYKGDPIKYHVIHPGAKETHPWHQHTMRWFADPKNHKSNRNDVQSIGPGESRELDIEGGAGSVTGTIGDSIFHCHLYPHFAQGFWGHLRTYDRLRDGTQQLKDGTPIAPLKELKDREGTTAAPDATHPGFPLFVEGDLGQRAFRMPYAVVKDDFASIRRTGDAPRGPTQLEKDNLPALNPNTPGTGFVDPCPAGARVRRYSPHAIDVPITFNSAGWKDPEGRMYVEGSQVAAVRNGTKQPEPYTIRANVGDCVELRTTNDLHKDDDPGKPIDHLNKKDGVFMEEAETSEVSTHVHLVKFDQLGSDGTSVGWNYVQAAMPGQTYGYRWYVDQALRTVFFHDHQYANLHQQKGLYAAMNVEPQGATWHDPKTGAATDGTGTVADIRNPTGPDFREFTVFYGDRTPMWRQDGRPVDPPEHPDDYGADQGGYTVNYRNEPFPIRTNKSQTGAKRDPAYVFSSAVHGDPSTPIFRAYPKDPVVIRHVVGSHEEDHSFSLHGHRWLAEPDNPKSAQTDSESMALAEFANYELQGTSLVRTRTTTAETLGSFMNGSANGVPNLVVGGAGKPGDYLYGETVLDNLWSGMWGIFRVPKGVVGDLKPLPDRTAPVASTSPWPALSPGKAIAPAPLTGESNPCPLTAPARTYAVSAIHQKIVYNQKYGDHDPNGVLYVLAADEAAVKAGTKRPEPLVIRANAGDCVKLTLTNKLPAGGIPHHTGDVPVPVDNDAWTKGTRVSMHASLAKYDVTRSDGATVGYNYDQTVAPGGKITYTWFMEPEVEGSTNLLADFGDRRGHRHHGLWGGLMVEPKGSTWTHPVTGAAVTSGTQADIKWTDASGVKRAQREFVIGLQDGMNLRDNNGGAIADAGEVDDLDDLGTRGINYRTERFAPRLAQNPETAWVMSSQVHGDPETPVFRAVKGDPVRIRLLVGQDRGRAHTFVLNGHSWNNQPADPGSMVRTSRGEVLVGRSFVFDLIGGAGGRQARSGDYVFRDGNLLNQTNQGLWGLLRVSDGLPADLKPIR
ncbi:MAG TPA: multicopper oxidase domain-containing protein, partial [Solirubrobacteraceae bacterium]|nr:multicopper oxidase domain-containing protein [Solirubrobacteraceae bacterium]